jgi:carbon monoxide dehydrogenase subunit G
LEHQFVVPAPPEVVWAAVIDPERVAPCMPGATLTAVDGPEFSGGVKVKLGPISLLYKGSGEFLETDEQARRVVIKASGKDSRGNGTASATVTVTLAPEGDSSTKGTVVTDLTVTGKPAQFGRGMIVEVGGKILDTFAACLAGKLDTSGDAPAEETPAVSKATPAAPVKAAATAKSAATRATPAKAAAAKSEPVKSEPVKSAPAKSTPAKPTPAKSAPATGADDAGDVHTDVEDEGEPPAKPKPTTRRRTTAKAPAVAAPKATPTVSADVTEAPASGDVASNGTGPDSAPHLQLVGETADTDQSAAATPAVAATPTATAKPTAVPDPVPAPAPKTGPRQINAVSEAEPIDLLDYAGPSVVKRLVPALLGVVAVVLLVRKLRNR